MLAHYLAYLVVAAFYYLGLASFLVVAAGIGFFPLMAFFGTFLLAGIAAPLALFHNRAAGFAALIALAVLGPWVVGLAFEMFAASWQEALFALVVVAPAAGTLYFAVRSIRGRSVARVVLPNTFRYVLAVPPIGLVAYLAYIFVSGMAQMSAA